MENDENTLIKMVQVPEYSLYMNGKRITEKRFKTVKEAKKWIEKNMIIIQKEKNNG